MAGYGYSLVLNTEVPTKVPLKEAGPGKAAEMQRGQWMRLCTTYNHFGGQW